MTQQQLICMAVCGAQFGCSKSTLLTSCVGCAYAFLAWPVLMFRQSFQSSAEAAMVWTVVKAIQVVLYWVFSVQCTGCWVSLWMWTLDRGAVWKDYSLLWNTNDHLLWPICFFYLHFTYPFLSLSLLHHLFLSIFLFHSFCHPMLNSLSILPSKPIILSLLPSHLCPLTMSSTAYSYLIKHSQKHIHTHTPLAHTSTLRPALPV